MWSGEPPSKDAVAQTNNHESNDAEITCSQRNGRERSLSVPCRSEATDVGTVMTKAKQASSYLWMLLHSQSCRLGVDRCTHAGCADTKLVHLHMKTCPAGHDFPCPTRYPGCVQARKLLAHYRQCRKIRARQAGLPLSLKGHHVCLICSMVARQARSLLDNNMPTVNASSQQGPVIAHKKSSTSSKCHVASSSSLTVKAKLNTGTLLSKSDTTRLCQRKILTTFAPSADGGSREFLSPHSSSQPGDWGMPPPAPRPGLSQSAPGSPRGGGDRRELQGTKNGVPSIPLFQKRSATMDGELETREVSFAAPGAHFFHHNDSADALLAVELARTDLDGTATNARRARSASCHLLSASTVPHACGTIFEEIGPAASCLEE